MAANLEPSSQLLGELTDWLRIPSISTKDGHETELRRAADWIADRVLAAGGTATLIDTGASGPLVDGRLSARTPGAPTVLVYGHYDVQDPGGTDAWTSPPFKPEVRNGRLYGRGASDDKGNVLPILLTALRLADAGALPVDVRILIEGEEERGSVRTLGWIEREPRLGDAAIVVDAEMADPVTPALTVGLRGLIQTEIEVRAATTDVHSGSFGGTVLNSAHVLTQILANILPATDGRVRDELRKGALPPDEAEERAWGKLPAGEEIIAAAGARELTAGSGDYYSRTGAEPSLDVSHLESGDPASIIPAVARASVGLRLAPGQRAAEIAPILESLLRGSAPAGVDVALRSRTCEPMLGSPKDRVQVLAARALARSCGIEPVWLRNGGSIPVAAALAQRGTPTVVTGFALPADGAHAVNESIALSSLALAERAAPALLTDLAEMPAQRAG